MAQSAVDLLSVDAATIAANVTAEALKVEQVSLETLDESALLAEAANVEAQLKRALAALEKKKAESSGACAGACGSGTVAFFEGTPIDCGRVAAAIVAELEEDESYLEAALAAVKSAIAKRKSGGSSAGGRASSSAGGRASSSAAPSTPSKAAASASALYEKVTNPESPLMKMGTSAVQLLDDTAVKVGQPRNVVAAAVIGAAVAAGAAIAGLFSKSRK